MSEPQYPQSGGQPPQGGQPQPPYGAQPGYGGPAPQAQDPGRTLGIVGLILSFFTALIGMIISIVAFRSSKKAGFKNTPALAGIIVGAVFTIGGLIATIVLVSVLGSVAAKCAQLGPGQHEVNGTTYTCS